MEDALLAMIDALETEIETVTDRGQARTIRFKSGERLRSVAGTHIYRCVAERPLGSPIEAVSVIISTRGITQSGELLGSSTKHFEVAVRSDLGDETESGTIEVDPTGLLEMTRERLAEMLDGDMPFDTGLIARLLDMPHVDHTQDANTHTDDSETDAGQLEPGVVTLDEFQRAAVAAAKSRDLVFIWGPPGTGKTRTVGALAAELVADGQRVLVCAHAHVAVDAAVLAALRAGCAPVTRIGTPQLADVPPRLVEDHFTWESVNKAGLYAMTLSRLVATYPEDDDSQDVTRTAPFDYVIVDEASMALLPHAIIAATKGEHFVVCGDLRQLSPVVQTSDNPDVACWLGRDVFEASGIADKIHSGSDAVDPSLKILQRQYRAHPAIAEVVNEFAYGGRLESAVETLSHDTLSAAEPGSGAGVVVVDTSSLVPVSIQPQSSRCNPMSALLAAAIAGRIVEQAPALTTDGRLVGIATPYAPQTRMLRDLLDDFGLSDYTELGTVHRFQGGEREAVIVDLCDATPVAPPPMLQGDEGMRLLNVAMSRARSKLVLVADANFLHGGQCGRALQTASRNGVIVDAASIPGLGVVEWLGIDDFLEAATEAIDTARMRVLVRAPKLDALADAIEFAGHKCDSVVVHTAMLSDELAQRLDNADVTAHVNKRVRERLVVADNTVFVGNTAAPAARNPESPKAMARVEAPSFAAQLATLLAIPRHASRR